MPRSGPRATVRLDSGARLSLGFFAAGLTISMVGGTLPGVWMLFREAAAGTFAALPPSWVELHAHSQVTGLFLCFILGFGYQAFPRFRGLKLRYPTLARASLPALILGWLLPCAAVAGPPGWPRGAFWIAGMGLTLAALLMFLCVVVVTGRGVSSRPPTPGASSHAGYAISAGLWITLGAVMGVLYAILALADLPTGNYWNLHTQFAESLHLATLHGGVLLMIVGIAQRVLPGFLSVSPGPSPAPTRWLPWMNFAVAVEVVAEWGRLQPSGALAWEWARVISLLVLSCGSLHLISLTGLWGKAAATRSPRLFFRFASGFLLLSLLLRLALPLLPWWRDRVIPHGLLDAARHAFTLGYATFFVVGVSLRVVPALALQPRAPEWLAGAVAWTLALAALTRVAGGLWSDFGPGGLWLSAISGVLALAALATWTTVCARAMLRIPARISNEL